MFKQKIKLNFLAVILLALGLSACNGSGNSASKKHGPVAIKPGDVCHLCGMLILKYPGPKGELYDRNGHVYKFGSTRDMFSWYLQPENRNNTEEIYVHDMGRASWKKPNDKYLIPARSAWYVVGSDMNGAMGQTLVSFKQKADAQIFILKHGGRLLPFKDITQAVMTKMNQQMMSGMGAK